MIVDTQLFPSLANSLTLVNLHRNFLQRQTTETDLSLSFGENDFLVRYKRNLGLLCTGEIIPACYSLEKLPLIGLLKFL